MMFMAIDTYLAQLYEGKLLRTNMHDILFIEIALA